MLKERPAVINSLRYFDTGEGFAPPYWRVRYLIESGYLTPANTLTDKGRELLASNGDA